VYASARWMERHEHCSCLTSFVKATALEKMKQSRATLAILRTDVRSSHHNSHPKSLYAMRMLFRGRVHKV
jgi:hypothetical protein